MPITIERRISSPRLQSIISYWHTLRSSRPAPLVDQIDPLDIPRAALPYVIVSEPTCRPFRVKYRLVGSHPSSLAAVRTGDFLHQLDLPYWLDNAMIDDYGYAAWACEPVTGAYKWPKFDGGHVVIQYAICPLVTRRDRVVRFLCGEHVIDDELGDYLHQEDIVPVREWASQH